MTKTEVCNRALAILGHDRFITDYDGKTGGQYNDQSTEAEKCRQFFPSALEEVLCAHDWDFAATEISILLSSPDENGYARFPVPSDCMRVIRATRADGRPLIVKRNRDSLFVKGYGCAATLRYISTDTAVEDFPALAREALCYQLAFLLSGPMFGSDQKTQHFMQLAQAKLSRATQADSDETASPGEWKNPLVEARR